MFSFIKLVLALCLLRVGPQDMPPGKRHLIVAAGAYSIIVLVIFSVTEWRISPLILMLLATSFIAVSTAAVLGLSGVPGRIPQTLTSLFASSALMSLLPLLLGPLADDGLVPAVFLDAVFLAFFFWSFAIDSHIFSQALNTSMWMGLVIAIILFFLNQILLSPWRSMV